MHGVPWVHLRYEGLIVQSRFFDPSLAGALSILDPAVRVLNNSDMTNIDQTYI